MDGLSRSGGNLARFLLQLAKLESHLNLGTIVC